MIWMRVSHADDPRLAEVASSLMEGEIAVVPTETVYGLTATLDPPALLKVFYAKGRPDYKPLILGVDGPAMARSVVSAWPNEAERLADAFWPGPLSLVLPKAEGLPLLVTAGGDTVAIRVPQHPIALKLIQLVGSPLVLTSANRTDCPPPQSATEAVQQLASHVGYVVDAGPTQLGVASTVYDVATGEILRQGAVSADEISAELA